MRAAFIHPEHTPGMVLEESKKPLERNDLKMDARPSVDRMIEDAQRIYQAAIQGVNPAQLIGQFPLDELLGESLDRFETVRVIGAGKASIPMSGAIERALGARLHEGLVVVPHGYGETVPDSVDRPRRIQVVEAGHPIPDAAGAAAASRALQLAVSSGPDDLLLVLISGGGSALWPAFIDPITLDDARTLFDRLLRSGAAIHEFNTVRKHISRIAGGRLARAAAPAHVLTLIISDVIGDDLSVIASGPTVPDPTTFADAWAVIERYDLTHHIPRSVHDCLQSGLSDPTLETPKPGDPCFHKVHNHLIGNNRRMLEAARREAETAGYQTRIVTDHQQGEARDVGAALAREAFAQLPNQPLCLLRGGETTVTVRGNGRGGRNQELTLAAALELDRLHRTEEQRSPIVILSSGSDGIDGPTDAAGAWATPHTIARAQSFSLDARTALDNNDAYPFFAALEQLLQPGPTHTNVMDIQIQLIAPKLE